MKVLISTSSFGKADSRPLKLCEAKMDVAMNPYGRKLTTEEFIDCRRGCSNSRCGRNYKRGVGEAP